MRHDQSLAQNESPLSVLIGSGIAGLAEIGLFHPYDTIAKRIQNHKGKTITSLNNVIFQNSHTGGWFTKYCSLYSGISYAAGYKIAQRIYKFGGQKLVKMSLEKHLGVTYRGWFGEATAGSIIGIGEAFLLPFDILKIKFQTNKGAMAGKTFFDIIKAEKWNLYNGIGWTMGRNAPGSFALFGGSAFAKEFFFKLKDDRDATVMQTFASSTVGSVASIVITNPIDVIKTRIQAHTGSISGFQIIRDIIKNENFLAFFKGTTPKILTAGPKVAFSLTAAQVLIKWCNRKLTALTADAQSLHRNAYDSKTAFFSDRKKDHAPQGKVETLKTRNGYRKNS